MSDSSRRTKRKPRTQDDDFLERSRQEMFPKLRDSAMTVTIVGEPDPKLCLDIGAAKLCLDIGAAILFDKPFVVYVPPGRTTPANLRRVAAAIIEGDLNDSTVEEKLKAAISRVMENDRRSN